MFQLQHNFSFNNVAILNLYSIIYLYLFVPLVNSMSCCILCDVVLFDCCIWTSCIIHIDYIIKTPKICMNSVNSVGVGARYDLAPDCQLQASKINRLVSPCVLMTIGSYDFAVFRSYNIVWDGIGSVVRCFVWKIK